MGKSLLSANILVAHLRKYKQKQNPYHLPFTIGHDNPLAWWNTIEPEPNYLQVLALKMLSIIPNSASCERNFSMLNWLTGKKRMQLNIETLESMSKLCTYYNSNAKKELSYFALDMTEESVIELLRETNTEAMDEAIINEELLPPIIDFPNADLPSGNTRAACAARLAALDNRNNELQLQDNVTLDKYTTKLEQSFQNNTLFIEEVLNLEAQELVEELEEFSYEEDDNFSNESLIDEEDKDTVMSLNEENTNWEINDVIGFDEE
jgi:hypothetical protein